MVKQIIVIFLVFLGVTSCRNSCRKSDCQNGSYCYEGDCICSKWYSGDNCQLFYNRNYEGTYEGHDNQPARMALIQYLIKADKMIPNRLNLESGIYMEFDSDSTMMIPVQQFLNGSDTTLIIGHGHYAIDQISFQYGLLDEKSQSIKGQPFVDFSGKRIVEVK